MSFFDRCPINVNGSRPSILSIYSVILSVYGDLVSCQLFYVCVPGFPVNKVITLIIEETNTALLPDTQCECLLCLLITSVIVMHAVMAMKYCIHVRVGLLRIRSQGATETIAP